MQIFYALAAVASAEAQQTVSVVFTTAFILSYVPFFTVKLSLRYLSLVRNRIKMSSLTKSLSLVLDFLVLQTVCSLVFYLANNNGCCVFYRVESLSGLGPNLEWFLPIFSLARSVSLFINICVNTCMAYILWWKGGNKVYNSESLCVLSSKNSYSNIFLNLKTHMYV